MIGPEPMIRIFEMSVRLGIISQLAWQREIEKTACKQEPRSSDPSFRRQSPGGDLLTGFQILPSRILEFETTLVKRINVDVRPTPSTIKDRACGAKFIVAIEAIRYFVEPITRLARHYKSH